MEAEGNPILQRITQGSTWLAEPAVRRFMAIVAVICALPALVVLVLDPHRETPMQAVPVVITFAGLALLAFNPLIAFGITTSLIQHEARQEDFAQLRLAGVRPATIAQGYTRAATYRLRYLWAFSLAFVPCMLIAIAHLFSATGISASCSAAVGCTPAFPLEPIFFGLIIGMLVLTAAAAISLPIYNIAILAGAWIGARGHQHAATIAAIITGLGITMLSGLAVYAYSTGNWAWLCMCAAPFILPFTGQVISAYCASRLEEAIELRSQVG